MEPFTSDDFRKLSKLKLGDIYEVTTRSLRNPEFHRKFFALIKIGFDNTKLKFPDVQIYRYYITLKAGYYVKVETPKGVAYIPKSISFDKMEQSEFEDLYNAVLQQIILDIGATKEVIENELSNFL